VPPLESSLLEAPVPDNAPPPSRRLGLVPIASGLVAVAAMASIAWWSAHLGGNLGPTVISFGATIAACALAIVVMRLACPMWKWQRQLVAAVIIGVGLLLSAGAWYGTLLTVKMKAYEPAWQVAVDRAVATTSAAGPSCTTSAAGYINMPGIGIAYGRCVVVPGPHNGLQVSFAPRSVSSGTGLLYMPDSSDARMRSDECLSHLDGPWWQVGWPNGNCPTGWTFIPGG
jgi:hypothetical protein